jgi:hypothetical protein
MNDYFLFQIYYNAENRERIMSIVNELIDTSISLEVNTSFQFLKREDYPVEKIYIRPFHLVTNRMMTENERTFHGHYLETYVHQDNISIECLSTDIN